MACPECTKSSAAFVSPAPALCSLILFINRSLSDCKIVLPPATAHARGRYTLLAVPRLFDDFNKLLRSLGNPRILPFTQGTHVHQIASNTESLGSRLYECRRCLERHAACRNHFDLWQRRLEGLEVAGSAHRFRGKHLDKIGSGRPRRHDFGRGQRARQDGESLCIAKGNRLYIERRADNELCARLQTLAGRSSVKHSASSEDCVRSK